MTLFCYRPVRRFPWSPAVRPAWSLGFEFVNGFHDTANAVATVIYTHSLEPNIVVVWPGLCNQVGVLTSAGTVAGTMAANKSGLPLSTIRNIAAAWVFTLPAAALLSGLLFALFRTFAK
jgi:inorganic phosphate transporter, PiT family